MKKRWLSLWIISLFVLPFHALAQDPTEEPEAIELTQELTVWSDRITFGLPEDWVIFDAAAESESADDTYGINVIVTPDQATLDFIKALFMSFEEDPELPPQPDAVIYGSLVIEQRENSLYFVEFSEGVTAETATAAELLEAIWLSDVPTDTALSEIQEDTIDGHAAAWATGEITDPEELASVGFESESAQLFVSLIDYGSYLVQITGVSFDSDDITSTWETILKSIVVDLEALPQTSGSGE